MFMTSIQLEIARTGLCPVFTFKLLFDVISGATLMSLAAAKLDTAKFEKWSLIPFQKLG